MSATVTLQIPEPLYQRLIATANAIHQPVEIVMLRALEVGSPSAWDDVPPQFQAELASLDRLPDNLLWEIARSRKSATEMTRYEELLDINQERLLSASEQVELDSLRNEADRFMLRKAQSAALLRWRGHQVPLS